MYAMSKASLETDLTQTTQTSVLKPPLRYAVVMLNDDYTPMDFVVEILQSIFAMDEDAATQTMLRIHKKGKAVCGIYTKDIAETKAAMANQNAREHEHPLMCQIAPIDE